MCKRIKGLLFISHRTESYDTLQSIELALKGGCKMVQLRMKDASEEETGRVAVQAKNACSVHGAMLFINDHVAIAKAVAAEGVHLGKSDMHPTEARKILGKNMIIGATANTFGDICRLAEAGVDYIGLGPFRFTKTKKDLSPLLGLEGYRHVLEQCREAGIFLPVFAIGGITESDVLPILQTGVSGIALSSSVLQAENPVEEVKKLVRIINRK